MTIRAEVKTAQFSDLLKEVEAVNEVFLMREGQTLGRIVPSIFPPNTQTENTERKPLKVKPIYGIKVLKHEFDRAEIAEELYEDRGR